MILSRFAPPVCLTVSAAAYPERYRRGNSWKAGGKKGERRREELGGRNRELFTEESSISIKKIIPPSSFLPANSSSSSLMNPDYLWEEYHALGFLRRAHPLALWKNDVLAVKYRTKALRIGDYVGRNVKMIGWPVTQKDVWTKDGQTMCFLSLEDETALYETVIFPDAYEKYSKSLFDQRPLLVYGRVTDDQGAVSLEVSRIEALRETAGLKEGHRLIPYNDYNLNQRLL